MNTEKPNQKEIKGDLDKWETPVLLALDTSMSEALNFANPLDADTGPKPS